MQIEQFKWKMVERPLIPIQNSWVDAAPFAALLLLFGISIFIILKFKKRQVLRHIVQLTSLIIFAFTFHRCFCTDRGLIFGISEIGKDNLNVFQNMCIFIPILAFIFIFGRIFCGWICPLGFIQEGLRKFNAFKRKILLLSIFLLIIVFMMYLLRPVNFFIVQNMASFLGFSLLIICFFAILMPKFESCLKKIKYVSLFIWIIFIILGVFVTSPWCAIYGNEIDYPSIIGLTSVVLAGSLVSMTWCRYVCPLGGLFSLLSRFCQYIIKGTSKLSNSYKDTCPMGAINDEGQVDTENCIYCLKCTERHGFKITKIISILIFSTFLYSSSLLADDWTTFGKDSKHTSSTSVNFNSPDLKNTWTFEPSQHIWNYEKTSYQKGMNVWSTSCATLEIDNKIIIYAGFYNHNLYAIDAETGEYIWRYATGGKLNSSPCAKEVGDRAMVFIGSSDRIVYAIDGKSGKKIWSYETEKWNYTASNGNPSSPIIEEIDGKNTLFICFWNNNFSPFKNIQKGEVFSFDAVTGELIWRIKLSDQPLNSPSFTYIDNKPMIFITSYDGNLYSVDAKTGLKLWNFTSDAAMHSSPTIIKLKEKDYVVFGTRFGNIYALDAVSGSVLWKFKTGHAVDSTCAFSVIEDRSIVFVGSHDRNLYAIDASDGKKIWSFQTENFITSSPAIGSTNNKPTIFVSSLDDYLYAIDVESGQKVWQYKTGPLIWEYATRGDTLWSSPVLLDTKNSPLLIFGSYDGKLYAFSSKSTGENRATEQ